MIKVNNEVIQLNKFPDKSFLIKFKPNRYWGEINNTLTISWFFENNEELFALISITKHIKKFGFKVKLFMPYCVNARQDRVKSDEDIFTLKYFADVINWLEFDSVTILDPHSYVSEALINNLKIINAKRLIDEVITCHIGLHRNVSVFYPDAGACKRYTDLKLNIPFTYGEKSRDWETGEIKGLNVCGDSNLIKGRDILIVDDICSRGGTFYHSAKKLKELGANKIYLYVSHCENTILDGDLLTSGLIEKVFTTNSIFTKEHEKIEVIKLEV